MAPRRPRTTATRSAPAAPLPRNADEVPVTAGMLYGVRRELIERIDALDTRLTGEIQAIKSDIRELKSDVATLKSDVRELKSDVATLKSDVRELRSDVHTIAAEVARIGVLVEEQNRRNAVVFDALHAFIARTERLEQRVDRLES